jgi:hypothetical protein
LELVAEKGDARPAIVCDDVNDLILEDLEATAPNSQRPVAVFTDVRRAWLHGCRAPENCACFLDVKGAKSAEIKLQGNELSGADKAFRLGADVQGPGIVTER